MTRYTPARLMPALLALLTILLPQAAAASVDVRDDDGSAEAYLDFDFSDDVAQKQLDVPITTALLGTNAKLWIYAYSWDCHLSTGLISLTYNGAVFTTFNPCTKWTSGSPGWASFSIPGGKVSPGINTFTAVDVGGSWSDRSVFFGIDKNHDYGRSVAVKDGGGDQFGELMWYVEVTVV